MQPTPYDAGQGDQSTNGHFECGTVRHALCHKSTPRHLEDRPDYTSDLLVHFLFLSLSYVVSSANALARGFVPRVW